MHEEGKDNASKKTTITKRAFVSLRCAVSFLYSFFCTGRNAYMQTERNGQGSVAQGVGFNS